MTFRINTATIFSLTLVVLLGCGRSEEISRYTVPKSQDLPGANPSADDGSQDSSATTARMLAAMFVKENRAWFFKVTGPDAAVAAQKEIFVEFVKSVRFTEGGDSKPEWNLPEGWQRQPGSDMRFATIGIDSNGTPLELTVIPLPVSGGDPDEYVLANVNRWRGQLGLKPIGPQQLSQDDGTSDELMRIDVDGLSATVVDLLGKQTTNRMGNAPFAGGAVGSPRPRQLPGPQQLPGPTLPPTAKPSKSLAYEVPEDWAEGKSGGMRRAAFVVKDGERSIEITVIDLNRGGDLLANVNRWRGQIQLGPMTLQQLDKEKKTLEVDAIQGDYVELVGPESSTPRETILGVIVEQAGRIWFFKLKGDAALAEREKQHFEEFVRTVRFPQRGGADDGR